MLQRISRILTAPPSITDEDYLKMKRIVGSLTNGKQKYEEGLQRKNNEKFFRQLKVLPGMYNAQQWEKDYKHQLQTQEKFMRKVRYSRPPGFVDPLAPPPTPEGGPRTPSPGRRHRAAPATDDMLNESDLLAAIGECDESEGEGEGEEDELEHDDFELEIEEDEGGEGGEGGAEAGAHTDEQRAMQVRSASHVDRVRARMTDAERQKPASAGSPSPQKPSRQPLPALAGGKQKPPKRTKGPLSAQSTQAAKGTPQSGPLAEKKASRLRLSVATEDLGFEHPREKIDRSSARLSKRTSSLAGAVVADQRSVPIRAWDEDDNEGGYDGGQGMGLGQVWEGYDESDKKLTKLQVGLSSVSFSGSIDRPDHGTPLTSTPSMTSATSMTLLNTGLEKGIGPSSPTGSTQGLSTSGNSGGKRRHISAAQRAELTQMDREIRIYTVETDPADPAGAPEGTEGRPLGYAAPPAEHVPAFSPGKEFNPTSLLSPGIIPGVSTFASTPREGECRSFYSARAEIKCWLLMEMRTLLIRVYVPDAFPLIDVQAQVSLRDLAANKSMTVDSLMTDFKTMETMAREIISEVELTTEDETALVAAAAKKRKEKGLSRGLRGAVDSTASFPGEEVSPGVQGKNPKPTRRTRLVVHMAKKGRRRHRSIAEAFLDEQFMSHMSSSGHLSGTGAGGGAGSGSAGATGAGARGLSHADDRRGSDGSTAPLRPLLEVPEPELLEVYKTFMVPVTSTVPSAKLLRMQGLARKTPNQAPGTTTGAGVSGTVTPSGGGGAGAGLALSDSVRMSDTQILSAEASRRPSFDGGLMGACTQEGGGVSAGGGGGGGGGAVGGGGGAVPGSSPTNKAPKKQIQGQQPLMKQLPKREKIEARVHVFTTRPGSSATAVENASIVVTFVANSKDNFNDRVAIRAGDEVRLVATLPSVMQADEELILEFFDNLIEGLTVVHESNLALNTASVDIPVLPDRYW